MAGVPASETSAQGLSLQQAGQNFLPSLCAVVIIIAEQRLFDPEMVEQFQGDAGIFCSDKVRVFQCLAHPWRDVLQIPNRCWNQIKHAWHGNSPFFKDRRRHGRPRLEYRRHGIK